MKGRKLLAIRLVKWTSVGELIYTAIYMVLFALTINLLSGEPFMGVFPIEEWVDVHSFAQSMTQPYKDLLTAMQIATCFYAVLLMILFLALYLLEETRKGYAVWGLTSGGISTVLIVGTYMLQFTYVRSAIASGNLDGLDRFILYNFHSSVALVNMMGYMLFGGLASIFFGLLFEKSRWLSIVKGLYIGYGVVCLLCMVLFISGNFNALIIWFGAMAIYGWSYILLAFTYHKKERSYMKNVEIEV